METDHRRPLSSPEAPPLDRILFRSRILTVGRFRAPTTHPRFRDSGPIQNHILVFPRTSVWIHHEEGRPFVASPNLVTYYNRGQLYRRDAISADGDRCEWFAFEPSLILGVLSAWEPEVEDRPEAPFSMSHGPSDPRSYLAQRLVVESLRRGEAEPLAVEETMVRVLERVLRASHGLPGAARKSSSERGREVSLAESAKFAIARLLHGAPSLADVAGAVGCSPFHLCRAFREATGTTIHEYREQLRLRLALELLRDTRMDLTEIALELGYSSHSHFTAAFRRRFGVPPSRVRKGSSKRIGVPYS